MKRLELQQGPSLQEALRPTPSFSVEELRVRKPWISDLPLDKQFTSDPPEGEGFLMKVKDPQILLEALVLATPETEDRDLVRASGQFAIEEHGQRKRRDNVTFHSMHVLRTATRWARRPGSTAEQIAVLALHDTVEDEKTPYRKYETYMQEHYGDDPKAFKKIFRGVIAFDKHATTNYYHALAEADKKDPDLRLLGGKSDDRNDSLLGDISQVVRLANDTSVTPDQRKDSIDLLRKSTAKAQLIPRYLRREHEHLLKKYELEIATLQETITYGKALLAKHSAAA